MFKCVKCDENGDYLWKGSSYCRKHFLDNVPRRKEVQLNGI